MSRQHKTAGVCEESERMTHEDLKTSSEKRCIDIYMHYHVSQTKDLPEIIIEAWRTGQELWFSMQSTRRMDRQQKIASNYSKPVQTHSFD